MNANVVASDALAPFTLARPPDSSGTLDASCCPGRTLPDRTEFSARQAGSRGSTDRKFHNNAYPLLCTTSTTPFDSGGCKGFCLPLPLFYNTCTESSCVDACTWHGDWSDVWTSARAVVSEARECWGICKRGLPLRLLWRVECQWKPCSQAAEGRRSHAHLVLLRQRQQNGCQMSNQTGAIQLHQHSSRHICEKLFQRVRQQGTAHAHATELDCTMVLGLIRRNWRAYQAPRKQPP